MLHIVNEPVDDEDDDGAGEEEDNSGTNYS